ncbi:hypothetical protein NDU88_003345 [Pleurodeles waltl]|uniref:Uncharacterized protein n=1 Tax=Pleurodeles waltl TaxID=8319 RepID=A0AAV7UY66_PLEWA|nr:hypothetical protein NDU88_003344 [Pleurodeles waltl]KAJ1194050.1 hypothetical protein NDU88_003345 [Pleurodeles waltl]
MAADAKVKEALRLLPIRFGARGGTWNPPAIEKSGERSGGSGIGIYASASRDGKNKGGECFAEGEGPGAEQAGYRKREGKGCCRTKC